MYKDALILDSNLSKLGHRLPNASQIQFYFIGLPAPPWPALPCFIEDQVSRTALVLPPPPITSSEGCDAAGKVGQM